MIDMDPQTMWDRVVDLHSLVLGWYDSRDLFHKIGYLTATGETLRGLVQLSRGNTKSAFEALLDHRIRDGIRLTPDDVEDLDYRSTKALPVLLLMNVETVRRMKHS